MYTDLEKEEQTKNNLAAKKPAIINEDFEKAVKEMEKKTIAPTA